MGTSPDGEMTAAWPRVVGRGGNEKWLDSDCLWKVVPMGFADR